MTRTEIEDYVKVRDVEHLVSDALYRTREMFLNIREDKKQHTTTLYSITKEIKMPPHKNEDGIVP